MQVAAKANEPERGNWNADPHTPTRFLKEFSSANWSAAGFSPALYGQTPEFLKQLESGAGYFELSYDKDASAPVKPDSATYDQRIQLNPEYASYGNASENNSAVQIQDDYPFAVGNDDLNKSMKRSASASNYMDGVAQSKRPKLRTMESSTSGTSSTVPSTAESAGDGSPAASNPDLSYDALSSAHDWNAVPEQFQSGPTKYANYYPSNSQQASILPSTISGPATSSFQNNGQSLQASLQTYAAHYPTALYQSVPLPLPPPSVSAAPKVQPTLHDRRASRATLSQQSSPAASVADLPTLPALAPIQKPAGKKAAATKAKGTKKAPRKVKLAAPAPAAGLAATDSGEVPEGSYADMDEGKRAQFLERNRLAACRSRQKKKEWISNMEAAAEDLTARNASLQQTVDQLRAEIVSMRGMMSSHQSCTCGASQPAKDSAGPVLHHPQPIGQRQPDANLLGQLAPPGKHARSLSLLDLDHHLAPPPHTATGYGSLQRDQSDIQIPRPSSAPSTGTPKYADDRFVNSDYFSVAANSSMSFATPNLASCLDY